MTLRAATDCPHHLHAVWSLTAAAALRIQDILEDLFLGAEVDLVLTGHVHLYARTCSVAGSRCVDRGGITHITLGARAALVPATRHLSRWGFYQGRS